MGKAGTKNSCVLHNLGSELWSITLPGEAEAHLTPDLLLLIHSHHPITDHVVHQVRGLDVLLQLVAKAQQAAPRPFLQRHLCTVRQPCRTQLL